MGELYAPYRRRHSVPGGVSQLTMTFDECSPRSGALPVGRRIFEVGRESSSPSRPWGRPPRPPRAGDGGSRAPRGHQPRRRSHRPGAPSRPRALCGRCLARPGPAGAGSLHSCRPRARPRRSGRRAPGPSGSLRTSPTSRSRGKMPPSRS
jgi:hypothetical protein